MPERLTHFPPVARADAKFLILGTFPGEKSLAVGQYYADSRNQFWRIMDAVLGISETDYDARLNALQNNHIALWDVLKHCTRESSADKKIKNEEPADFQTFFDAHPQIEKILFNGKKDACEYYDKLVRPHLSARHQNLMRETLQSSSSVNTTLRLEEKTRLWREALG
jgi:hypoxanthine-DNA glycosylase